MGRSWEDPSNRLRYRHAHLRIRAELDAAPRRDPETNLPYDFIVTPRPLVVPVHARSPEFNERHHPFCGLLASMHTWGLYHGRYGLSERATIDSISPADKPAVLAMLQGELARQARLQGQLAADSGPSVVVQHALRDA